MNQKVLLDLPTPSEVVDGVVDAVKESWDAVLAVWAEAGTLLVDLLKAAFQQGKMLVEALEKGIEKAKIVVKETLKKFESAVENIKVKFGILNPDSQKIERIGIPDGFEDDGGLYIKILDCDGKFKDTSRLKLGDGVVRKPYFECAPYINQIYNKECKDCLFGCDDPPKWCKARNTKSGYRGKYIYIYF